MTSILIVADIRLYREGLAQALARQSSFDLIGTAGDAPGAIAQLRAQTHDMVLVDMAMAGSLLRRLAELASALPLGPTAARLTPRESEIMRLLDDGLANKDIARRLGIEVATVKNHVHNILDKLQVHRRAEAAAIMRKVLRTNPTPHLSAAG